VTITHLVGLNGDVFAQMGGDEEFYGSYLHARSLTSWSKGRFRAVYEPCGLDELFRSLARRNA
jgi:hypothetical protein